MIIRFGIINSEGKTIVDFKYDALQKIENTNLIEGIINDETDLLSRNLDVIVSLKQANIEIENDYIKIYSIVEKEAIYLDKSGNSVNNKDILKNNKLFAKKENGKWGFVSNSGDFKVEAKYDMVTDFNKYGFAGIMINNKWGVINVEGNIIQEPEYEIENETLPTFIGKYYEVYLGYGEKFYESK